MVSSGWIADDLGIRIWSDLSDICKAGAKLRSKGLPTDVEPPAPHGDPALDALQERGLSTVFRLVTETLLLPTVKAPITLHELLRTGALGEWLGKEQQRHWRKELKARRARHDAARRVQRKSHDALTQMQLEIGMPLDASRRPEAPAAAPRGARAPAPAPAPASSTRLLAFGTRASPLSGTEPESEPTADASRKRARSMSPDMITPATEQSHAAEFHAVYRRKVVHVLEQLAALRGHPVVLEHVDLGSQMSVLVTQVRKRALYAVYNHLRHAMGEPLFAAADDQKMVPPITKTQAVIKGYDEGAITFLTRPEEDQVTPAHCRLLCNPPALCPLH